MGKVGRTVFLIGLFLGAMLVSACSEGSLPLASTNKNEVVVNDYEMPKVGDYDSFDTAVVASIDQKSKTITFYNVELSKFYELNYNGASKIADSFYTPISVSQISLGDVVDVWFLKSNKMIAGMSVSGEIFELSGVTGFEVSIWEKTFKTGRDTYRISDDTFILSENKRISLSELNPDDFVTVKGKDNTIYSVVVDSGHGYISLENADYFVGGFIEIGPKYIYQIDSHMLFMVPEGKYSVHISNKGTEATREVQVSRNNETMLDLSDVEIVQPKQKTFYVDIVPEDASVKIDGVTIDSTKPVQCTYGMHKLVATKEGYKTYTKYFTVDENTKSVKVSMLAVEKEDVSGNDAGSSTESSASASETSSSETSASASASETSASSETSSDTSASASDSSSEGKESTPATEEDNKSEDKETDYYVTVPAPSGVEIYWDGNYMGLAPLSFKKQEGTHVITLRKNGCETRSFTVMLDDSEEDVSFTFDELEVKKTD